MGNRPMEVLLVEDNPADARLLIESLKEPGAGAFRVTRVARLQEAVEAFAKGPVDVVVLDLSLPDASGLATVDRLQAAVPGIPIVVLTGLQDEKLALEAVRRGVQDYLVKGQCENGLAPRALRYAVERQRVEDAMRDSLARLSAVVGTAVDAIITIDEQGRIESVNPATERLFGYAPDEMVGQNVKMIMPEPYRGEHDEYLRRYLRTGEARIIGIGREVVGLRKDGTTVPLNLSVSEFRLVGRRMFTGILHDVTEPRRLEREVLDISSAEQRRIGQDLHDGLCQELVGVAFAAKLLAGRLAKKAPEEAAAAGDLAALVDGAITQARTLAHGLNPVELQGGDLAAALEALATKVSSLFQVDCRCTCEQRALADSSSATHLYRIAQEAISNAVKHGKAKRIDVSLTATEAWVTLSVKDDGRGIPPVLPATAGIGLSTMSYRARVIGGSFSVQPRSHRGTVVTCVLPRPPVHDAPETNDATRKHRGGRRRSSHSGRPAPSNP